MIGGMVLAARLPRRAASAPSTPARTVSRMVTESRGDGRVGIWLSSSHRTLACACMGFMKVNDADCWKYKRSIFCLRFSFEVTEETCERLLVGIMVFPVGEVANMTFLADVFGPCLGGLHDAVIQAHREKDLPILPM